MLLRFGRLLGVRAKRIRATWPAAVGCGHAQANSFPGRQLDERSDPLGIRRSRGIVDHHAEIGPAVDREGRVFESDRSGDRMPQMFDAAAIAADVVVAPHRLEFGTEPAEFVHEGCDFGRRPGARRIRPERPHHEPGDGLPIELSGANAGIAEDEAQHVALLRRERAIVGQHRSSSAVPGDDVPCDRAHNGRAELQCVEHALKPGRHTLGCLVANLGRPAEAEQEEVLALDVGQHQRASDPVEHVGRGRAAPALLEPRVPGGADIGALRHLFAAQAGRAASLLRESRRPPDRALSAGLSDRSRAGSRV